LRTCEGDDAGRGLPTAPLRELVEAGAKVVRPCAPTPMPVPTRMPAPRGKWSAAATPNFGTVTPFGDVKGFTPLAPPAAPVAWADAARAEAGRRMGVGVLAEFVGCALRMHTCQKRPAFTPKVTYFYGK